jgi:tyrosine-protein kinase Etk/Wzc
LLADYTEKFPEVVSTNEKIVQIRMSIRQIVKNTISQLGSQLEATSEIIEKYNDQLKQLPEKERELAGLKRNAAVSAEIYTFLLQKLEEARIAKASTLSNIRVIDMAVVPQGAISPNIRLNLMLGLIAGLLLAVGIAFFLEFIDDSLKTVEEVERHINRPLYGIIPRIPEGGFGQDDSRTESSGLITQASPKSPISEAFRSMRTNIHFADPDQELTTLLVTSAGPSEGKSTIVANLAVTIANSGKKTLLIDCDLRKPNIHNLFQMERGPGLTNTLTGEMDWTEVVKPSETENLSIITSGPIPPNPTEMIDSKAMRDQLEVFKKEFDMILFDSPPVVAVTDAAILSSYIEGVLLVVELGRSRASGVLRAIDLLDKVKANLLGLVTNNISASYRYDYGYYYKYYSADGEKKRSKRGRSRYGQ